ncbi:hypothetical protein LP415_28005 [Polaromonas sp. P1(28)-8]|nr:hypothetical protein LP415_28005 [Polaromonas sp. P1(28)-8]
MATPTTEFDAIKDLYAHLAGLKYSVEAWDAGLQLYKLALRPPSKVSRDVASKWRFVAAGECVLELHHLKKRIEKIRGVKVKKCPSLSASIDTEKLRQSAKLFDDYFPNIRELRDAMAHAGEFDAHPEVHAPDGMFALKGFREPHVFSAPFKRQLYQLPLTDSTLSRMVEVVEGIFHAFVPASKLLESQGHVE